MEGGVEKPKPCKHRTKVEIDADKVAKVVIVGSVLGLGFERTKFFGEEKSEAWKGEIKSPCNMEKPSQKTKEVKNLSNSNDDLNESLSKPSWGEVENEPSKKKKKGKSIGPKRFKKEMMANGEVKHIMEVDKEMAWVEKWPHFA